MTTTRERIEAALEGLTASFRDAADAMPTLHSEPDELLELMGRLKNRCDFEVCTLVTAVDHFPRDPRFELCWQLQSVTHGDRVRLHAFAAGDPPSVASITGLWPGAAYYERECYDLMGVVFTGHEDFHGRANLRRLLMPEAFEHHPLRKDFPHAGIEPDKLYKRWDAERRKPASSE